MAAAGTWLGALEKRVRGKLGKVEFEREIAIRVQARAVADKALMDKLDDIKDGAEERDRKAEAQRELMRRTVARLDRSVAILNDREGRTSAQDSTDILPGLNDDPG